MSRPSGVRLAAEVRHQSVLIARDPGPLIGYTVMGLLLITATRPLYAALSQLGLGSAESGIDRAAAGMAVMFSLFALKVGAAQLLNERTWHTWDRLRTSPAGFGEILVGKSLPILVAIAAQQALLFGFAAAAFGLHPRAGWWALAACALAWSACVLFLGIGASTLARSPAQLSAAGDVFALLTTVLGGAIVPVALLPGWMRARRPGVTRLLGPRRVPQRPHRRPGPARTAAGDARRLRADRRRRRRRHRRPPERALSPRSPLRPATPG